MASLRQRDISKCWSHWKCSDCSVPLRTALLPHLQLKMFSILLSAYIWISPTCWAPVTASSWEGRRREQFERCRESCLWKHHLKKKKKSQTTQQRSCKFQYGWASRWFISCCLNWKDSSVMNKRQTFLVYCTSSLRQRLPELRQYTSGDRRSNRSHKRLILTDPAAPKVSGRTPWEGDRAPGLVGHLVSQSSPSLYGSVLAPH